MDPEFAATFGLVRNKTLLCKMVNYDYANIIK